MKLDEPTVLKIREHTLVLEKKVLKKKGSGRSTSTEESSAAPEIKVMVTGDWHISPIISERQAEYLREAVEVIQPDAIVLQGDIIDSPMELKRETSVEKLIRELKICSDAAPTMMVLGSHDFITPTRPPKMMKNFALDTWKKICKKCNVKLLLNESYEPIPGVEFFGLFQDERCILTLDKNGNLRHGARPEGFLEILCEQKFKLDPKKINWFVTHAPLFSEEAIDILSEFDIASFGHTHGGIVPRGLDEIYARLGIHSGLVGTNFKPFPRFVRGAKIINGSTLILINPGMTGAQFCTPRFFQNMNFVKAAEVSVVKLVNKNRP